MKQPFQTTQLSIRSFKWISSTESSHHKIIEKRNITSWSCFANWYIYMSYDYFRLDHQHHPLKNHCCCNEQLQHHGRYHSTSKIFWITACSITWRLKKVDSEEWRRNQVSLQICYIHGHCNYSAHFVILFPPFKDRLKWHRYFSSSSTFNFWPVQQRVSQPYSLKDFLFSRSFSLSYL